MDKVRQLTFWTTLYILPHSALQFH